MKPGESDNPVAGELVPSEVDEDLGEEALLRFRAPYRYKSFADMTVEERREMQRRGVETQKRRRLAKKLAELEAYKQAHRERAAQILGTNLAIYDSITEKALGDDRVFDHTRLSKAELDTLLKLGAQLEERGHGKVAQKTETSTTVNVMHVVAELRKGLTGG